MASIVPAKFHKWETVLTLGAIASGVWTIFLAAASGYAAVFAILFCCAIGTIFFTAVGGAHRIFFTTVFSFTVFVGLIAAAAIGGRVTFLFTRDGALILGLALVFTIILPIGIAWMVTKLLGDGLR
jgi:hypothetical protein